MKSKAIITSRENKNGKEIDPIEEIIDSRKDGKKLSYLVKWKGRKKLTWEHCSYLNYLGANKEFKKKVNLKSEGNEPKPFREKTKNPRTHRSNN